MYSFMNHNIEACKKLDSADSGLLSNRSPEPEAWPAPDSGSTEKKVEDILKNFGEEWGLI